MDWIFIGGFFLVLVRTTAFLAASPIFLINSVPAYTKVGFGLVLSGLIFSVMDPGSTLQGLTDGMFILIVIQETLVGLVLGYTATLVLSAIRIGGQLIDLHMGFSMASLFDPESGDRTTLMGQFLYIIAVLLFLVLDGHHTLLYLLRKSYEVVPLTGAIFKPGLVREIIALFSQIFALAFKIAAPVIVVIIISDLALSFVSRTVPQLNVFIMGFPLKAGVGMLTLIILLPLFVKLVGGLISEMEKDLLKIMWSIT